MQEVSVWMCCRWDVAQLLPIVLLESMRIFIILEPTIISVLSIKFPIRILSEFALVTDFFQFEL
jgi:hypothetical protein